MRFFKLFIVISGLITVHASCKKTNDTVALEPNFYFLNGGTSNLDKTLILFSSSDTITYNVVVSSTYYLASKALIKIAAADQYRDSYNSDNATSYAAMPAGSYSFRDTITANINSIYDTIAVTIYKHALSSDKEYMLPLQIIEAGNYKIDSASSVIYLHTSNSALSGIYNSTGVKTMYIGDASDNDINSVDSFSLVKRLIPVSVNHASYLDYADLGPNGWQYIVGFSTEDSSFFALPNDVILNSVQAGSFKVLAASFDSTTSNIYIKTSYKNLSGDERIVEESLTLQ